MTKLISITGLLTLLLAGYFYLDSQKPKDLCHLNQLRTSQLDLGTKDKVRLKIHMGYSYDSRVSRYLPYIKKAQSNVYYKGRSQKPELTSLTTEFSSRKVAWYAYKYLQRKWKKNKKNQYDVVWKDKTVTWFGNSRYTPQCFYKVVEAKKKQWGITDRIETARKHTRIASKKKYKKSRRHRKRARRSLASVKK